MFRFLLDQVMYMIAILGDMMSDTEGRIVAMNLQVFEMGSMMFFSLFFAGKIAETWHTAIFAV